tara:strand:- start:1075 stop:1722 length:648 start_codon:yes stop_codon:yes gene_type:complete
MYLEFCSYNTSHFERVEKQTEDVFDAVALGFSGIAIPVYLLKKIATFLSSTPIDVAAPIDFPQGTSDNRLRMQEALLCLKEGADFLDIPINPFLVKDMEYSKMEVEIKSLLRACNDYGACLRPIIHHELYGLHQAIAISRLLYDCGVTDIIPASGFHNDDIYNNILTCVSVQEKTGLSVLCNGHIWLKSQYDSVIRSNISSLRLYSTNLLSSFSV